VDTNLLELPAPLGVRRIAIGFLDDAVAAHARLAAKEDGEALHDFRVALRRMRSWLRADAWAGGTPPKKIARRARKIARATSTARDAEVLVAWATDRQAALRPGERRAVRWLGDWLHAREGKTGTAVQSASEDFRELAPHWRESLATVRIEAHIDAPQPEQPFRQHATTLIRARCDELSAAMAAIRGFKDREAIHRARIAGKRLRYAIEPLAPLVPAGESVITAMKTIQDDFGYFCDRDVFIRLLAKAARAAGKEAIRAEFARALSADTKTKRHTPSAVPGLVALAALANSELRTQYRRLRHLYLAHDREGALDAVRRLADDLAEEIQESGGSPL
jgi:CHAD domain-containing protein